MYKFIAQKVDFLTEDEAFEHLAKSIVIQAIEDYRNTLHGKSINRHVDVRKDRAELEIFFKSEWCTFLSEWNGETLIKLIKEQEGVSDERTVSGTNHKDLSH